MNVCCVCGVKLDDPTKVVCDKCEMEFFHDKYPLSKEETAALFEKFLRGEKDG